ncbi:SUMO1 sentrin specific peptidase 8 [Allomyces javanicus]|nr:SUMO1 sentrin specific peptidase 8 [Allomyces javanicus]
MTNDPIVLSRGDVCLYASDLRTLDAGQWITDTVIAYWFESASIFHDPTIAAAMLTGSPLFHADVLFIPVNDFQGNGALSGTHWSLLVFDRHDETFRAYDSLGRTNLQAARDVAKLFWAMVKPDCADSCPAVQRQRGPRQSNMSDCGINVLYVSRVLTERLLQEARHQGDQGIESADMDWYVPSPLDGGLAGVRRAIREELQGMAASRAATESTPAAK